MMIERVAKALFEYQQSLSTLAPEKWEYIGIKNYWYNVARVAIEAMREPTEEMIERGDRVRGNHDDTWHKGNSTASVYESMIDKALALSEKESV